MATRAANYEAFPPPYTTSPQMEEKKEGGNVRKWCIDSSKVFRTIEGKNRMGDEEKKIFSIRVIPEDRYDETLDFLCNYYIPDEPFSQLTNVEGDRDAVEDLRREWRSVLQLGISLGAFLHDKNSENLLMVGVNVLYVDEKGFEPELGKFKSKMTEKAVKMSIRILNEADIYGKYQTESYFGGMGLAVHPRYRGHALAKHILDARTEIGKEIGIPVTATCFTGPQSQLIAERAGFEVLFEQRYNEILDDNGEAMFPVDNSEKMKVMGKRLY